MRKRLPKNRLKPDAKKHIVDELDQKESVEKKRITGAMLIRYVSAYYNNLKAIFMCFFIIAFLAAFVFLFINSLTSLFLFVFAVVFFCFYLKNKKNKKNANLREFYIEKHPLKSKYSRQETDEDGYEYIYYYFTFDVYREFRIDRTPSYFHTGYSDKRIFNSATPGDGVYLLFKKDKSKKIRLALPETFFELEHEDFTEAEGRYYPIQQKAEERFEKERLEIKQELELIREKSAKKPLPPERKKLKK